MVTFMELLESNGIPFNKKSNDLISFIMYMEVFRLAYDQSIKQFISDQTSNDINLCIIASRVGLSAGIQNMAKAVCKKAKTKYDPQKFDYNKIKQSVFTIVKHIWNDADNLYAIYCEKAINGELDLLLRPI